MTNKNSEKKKFFNYKLKFWLIWVLLLAMGFVFFYGVAAEWFGNMPTFEELENPKSNLASEVYSSDGELLGTYFIENRSNISYRDISPNLINALVAIEDIRFEKHSGIDEKALVRVFMV